MNEPDKDALSTYYYDKKAVHESILSSKSERASLSGSGKDKDEKKKLWLYYIGSNIGSTSIFVLCDFAYVFLSDYADSGKNKPGTLGNSQRSLQICLCI